MPWWSITKTALAACALVLVAGGRLELDRPLAGRRFTLRQLLQHTSGLGCYTEHPDYEAAVDRHEDPWSGDEHARSFGKRAAAVRAGAGLELFELRIFPGAPR